ncbi:MAG: uroporphyrinogen decarboxylase [Telmatospirillum sp.]|nr:uroporphyrinogen decarboxylase [Telmatospirillum sp.]
MNKVERVKAALAFEPVDHIPVSVWMHIPSVDQDPKTLAETQVEAQKAYDLDFIKLMPYGLFSAQDWGCQVKFFCDKTHPPVVHKTAIDKIDDWKKIEVLPPYFCSWGKQVLLARYVRELVRDEVPVVQTVFSPLTTARKLAGDRIFEDMKTDPQIFHAAMEKITETTIGYIRENIRLGVSGFFFATQCATQSLMSDAEYDTFARHYDLRCLEAANQGTWFNILHIHGQKTRFAELARYPVQALNWHDRREYPSLKTARTLTDKCLIGGMDEEGCLSKGLAQEVSREVTTSIQEAGARGLMIGPGCVAFPDTPAENIRSACSAARRFLQ